MDGAGVSAAGAEKPGSPSLEVDIEVVNSCGDPTEDGEGEEEMDDTPAVDKSDGRYAYVDRGFTSELYKLEICNLPKFIGFQVCRSLVCCNVYLRALIWLILNSFPHTLPPILLGNPFPCALIPNLTSGRQYLLCLPINILHPPVHLWNSPTVQIGCQHYVYIIAH